MGGKNILNGKECEQGLVGISKCSESLSELQRERATEEIEVPQNQLH